MQHLIWVYNRESSYLFLHMEENRDGKAFFGRPLACSSSGESFTPVGIPRHESWIHAGVERDWLASAAPRGANKPWWRQRAADFPPNITQRRTSAIWSQVLMCRRYRVWTLSACTWHFLLWCVEKILYFTLNLFAFNQGGQNVFNIIHNDA